MAKLPLYPKHIRNIRNRQVCQSDASMPLCYMGDYSIMGCLVDDLGEAVRLLERNHFTMKPKAPGVEILIEEGSRMGEIFQTFQHHGIDYEIADVVSQVYQG